MIRRPPRSTRTDTLVPYTTLFRSRSGAGAAHNADGSHQFPGHARNLCASADNVRLIPSDPVAIGRPRLWGSRSEEHTSELQSLMRISYAVFCLKKKSNKHLINDIIVHTPYEQNL